MEQTLKLSENNQVKWEYDQEADVLIIHLADPRPAITYDAGNGFMIRHDERTGEILASKYCLPAGS